VTALALVFISAAAAWPTARFGERAYNNILTLADEDGRAWLEAHAERAESLLYAYYCLAALAAAAIFLPRKWRRSARPLAVATLIFAVVSLGAGASIAYAGGKIRHREFRTVPPPEKKPTAQRG
jgi:alpha-D-ribose 1-methylphosphonate 5-triphosphate synthase subunit PhnH